MLRRQRRDRAGARNAGPGGGPPLRGRVVVVAPGAGPAPRITLHGLPIESSIHVAGSELTIESCRFEGCEAPEGGAVLLTNGMLSVANATFVGNQATNGGGIHASGVVWLFGARICGHTPDQVFGAFNDGGGNVIQDNCCRADFNGDGFVDGADLTDLLAEWGTDGSLIAGTDINWDGLVDGGDLNLLLGDWGSCD